jgi:hypothetical protein
MATLEQKRNPIKKIHYVGTSAVLTIDQSHIHRLGVNELTFFEEIPIENGIQLEVRKLIDPGKEEKKYDKRLPQSTRGKRFDPPYARALE